MKIIANFEHYWKWVLTSLVGAILGYLVGVWCDGYFKVEPQIKTLINRIDSLNSTLIALKEGSDVVKEHIVQKSENGTNCKVGYSVNIRGNVAYVGKNNSLNLKKTRFDTNYL